MKLTQTSQMTGDEHTLDIPMTQEEFDKAVANWEAGMLIQHAFESLDADQREFIQTGITAQEWESFS